MWDGLTRAEFTEDELNTIASFLSGAAARYNDGEEYQDHSECAGCGNQCADLHSFSEGAFHGYHEPECPVELLRKKLDINRLIK